MSLVKCLLLLYICRSASRCFPLDLHLLLSLRPIVVSRLKIDIEKPEP